MISQELFKKIKTLELKTRRLVTTTLAGQYHSAFKGQGMCFADVREYTPGDDIRFIDWNLTAKTGLPHIKQFEEERELTVIILMDVSGSGEFGSHTQSKIDCGAEIAAGLGFSAVQNNDRVGLLMFSDQIEHYSPPRQGKKHMFRLIREMVNVTPESRQTNISNAIEYALKVIRKKAIIFLISDFIDPHYHQALKTLNRKHEVVPIVIEDPKELVLPKSGLVTLEDDETGEQVVINTYSNDIRMRFRNIVLARRLERNRSFKSMKLRPITINTEKPFWDIVVSYFQTKRLK